MVPGFLHLDLLPIHPEWHDLLRILPEPQADHPCNGHAEHSYQKVFHGTLLTLTWNQWSDQVKVQTECVVVRMLLT